MSFCSRDDIPIIESSPETPKGVLDEKRFILSDEHLPFSYFADSF